MAKHWSANSLVVQVLLICLLGTNVEVRGQHAKGASFSQGQSSIQPPSSPKALPGQPGFNQYNRPNVPGGFPSNPQAEKGQPGSQPSSTNSATNFQPGGYPSSSTTGFQPGVSYQPNQHTFGQPGSQPTSINNEPKTQPGGRQTYPQTNVQPGSQPASTNYGSNFQPGRGQGYSQSSHQVNSQPGSQPTSTNNAPKAQPGGYPSYPQTNVQPGSQPTSTNNAPKVQPGGYPSYPQTNVQPGSQPTSTNYGSNFQPGRGQVYSQSSHQVNSQPGSQPTSTNNAPKAQPGGYPSYPQTNVQPGSQPTSTNKAPKVQPGGYPSYPQTNVQPGSQPTSTNNAPKVQPGGYPSYPQTNVQPGSQPTSTNNAPKVQPGGYPSYPQTNVQPGGRQTYPQTNVQPGGYPSYPQSNQQTNVQPGSQPVSTNNAPNVQPGGYPSYHQSNQQTNVQPGSQPTSTNNAPKVQPGGYPSYHQSNQQTNVQPGSQPTSTNNAPKVQPGGYPSYPQRRQPANIRPAPQSKPSQHSLVYHDHSPQEPFVPESQKPQQPKQPQLPTVPETSYEQSCEVPQNVRVPCGGPAISAAGCEAINCCFDGRQCYFGKAVTVQCTKDAQFIVVVARDATVPSIDLDKISLLGDGQGCGSVDSNSAFHIYQFPVTTCGSVVMEEPGVITYENRMKSLYDLQFGSNGIITRDSCFELLFQCRYMGTSVETVVIEVLPLQDPPLPVAALGPIRVQLRLANGQCSSKGCNEVDAAYSSFYTGADYPVTKVLRDPVFVEVQLMEKTDPNLVLTLGHCWTTTSPNPHTLPQWDILIDGCPYRDDRYMSSLVPVGSSSGLAFPSHHRRFIFKMFTFVDSSSLVPLREQVYIHCSTAVCTSGGGRSCEPSCFRKKRETKSTQTRGEAKVVVSAGPVTMIDQRSE